MQVPYCSFVAESRVDRTVEIARGCTRFLNGHGFRTVRERLQRMADSPLSLERNDHYGRGGVVEQLELRIAELLGKEAAVVMPSGTMAQQIALRIWSDQAGFRRVAFHPTCHLEIHEQMAYRELHGLEGLLVGEADRLFTLEDLKNLADPVSVLLIELPQREIGGQLPTWKELTEICDEARSRGMRLHMDGARLWECGPYYGRSYAEISGPFDSVYVSFYKLLFGFPGAALAGPADLISEARIWQRRHGGNLQQQTPCAISAFLGLEEQVPLIPRYVQRAGEIARVLACFDRIRIVPDAPPTNMMHLYLEGDPDRLVEAALQIAEEEKVGLFFGLPPDGMWELNVGGGALEVTDEEVRDMFTRLFELAGD